MKNKIKVLYVIDSLRRGGAERQFVELLKNLDRKLIEPVVIYLKHEKESYLEELVQQGISPILISRSGKLDIRPVFHIYRLVKKHDVDLIHSVLNMAGIFGAMVSWLSGVPHVCSVIREARDPNRKLRLIRKSLAYVVDAYVANTKTGLDNRFSGWRKNFHVIYNGFDVARFSNPRLSPATERQDNVFVVGMVASLSPYKDHLTLLKSICLLRDRMRTEATEFNWKLLLVGDGETRSQLQDFVATHEMEDRVVFTGQIPHVERIYPDLDVSVMLTNGRLHAEGISNSIVEAMACGIPVVATRDGGTVEFVESGANGILVDNADVVGCADALERLFMDVEFRQQLGQCGQSTVVQKFSMEKYVSSYMALYTDLVPENLI